MRTRGWCLGLLLATMGANRVGRAQEERSPGPTDKQAELYGFLDSEWNLVSIASKRQQTREQAPSIVSVITRSEIEAYGARDLTDILRMVPGFEFGIDVVGAVGQSFRGIWVYEGKSLIMLNGLTVNELAYGNVFLIGSVPAASIDRVEIIRGPGSALYGGFAEVTTINVITRWSQAKSGIKLSGGAGTMDTQGKYLNVSGDASGGIKTEDFEGFASIGYDRTPLSPRDYQDFFGGKLSGQDSGHQWSHAIVQAQSHGLTLNYKRANFNLLGQDGFTTVIPKQYNLLTEYYNNYSEDINLKYAWKASDSLVITPQATLTNANPLTGMRAQSALSSFEGSASELHRYHGELGVDYSNDAMGTLNVGVGYIRNLALSAGLDNSPGFRRGADPLDLTHEVQSYQMFGYGQYTKQLTDLGLGVTVGARYERTTFGNAFAPRLGLTYQLQAFNAKLLYGRAFRIPSPWQRHTLFMGYNNVHPELTDTYEMELGYAISENIRAHINGFFIDIKEPIVYNGGINTYLNYGMIQSMGAEAEVQANFSTFGGFFNMSYARPGKDTSPGFVTADKSAFLASPPLKANAGAYMRFGMFEVGPSLTILSSRYGQSATFANNVATDPTGYSNTKYDGMVLANLNLLARGIVPGVDVHLTAHNLTNAPYTVLQPYYGGHAPLPVSDRQITAGLTWNISPDASSF